MVALPIIDISSLFGASERARNETASAIGHACNNRARHYIGRGQK